MKIKIMLLAQFFLYIDLFYNLIDKMMRSIIINYKKIVQICKFRRFNDYSPCFYRYIIKSMILKMQYYELLWIT